MLYVTTRNRFDVYTPRHALVSGRGKCGGYFRPYRFPVLTDEQIAALPEKTFGQRIAEILNLFFGTDLNGLDIDFTVGRNPVRPVSINHKITVLETWHNSENTFEGFLMGLFGRMEREGIPGTWFRIAARIAVLTAVCADLMKAGAVSQDVPIDLAVPADSFEGVVAAWYARKMGFPVGTILIPCDGSSGLWDFFHHGELPAKGESGRYLPACFEVLIAELFGYEETQRYLNAVAGNTRYAIREDQLQRLRKGMCCTVIRRQRAESMVCNVHKTNAYLMTPNTAFAYCSLQDYRATNGETGAAMIFAEESPMAASQILESLLGISAEDIKK